MCFFWFNGENLCKDSDISGEIQYRDLKSRLRQTANVRFKLRISQNTKRADELKQSTTILIDKSDEKLLIFK